MSHVNDRTDQAIRKIRVLIQGDLEDFVENFAELTKEYSPKRPAPIGGHNAASVTIKRDGKTFRVVTESGYGAYLELGTHKMTARPYFMPAFLQSVSEFSPHHD